MRFLTDAIVLAVAAAEIGLSVHSSIEELSEKPVRIVDGTLVVGGEFGPILQANFVNGSMILSDRVVSQSAFGAGISVNQDDGMLSIAYKPSQGFFDRNGWLEFDGMALFGVKNDTNGWHLYANRPDLQDEEPVLLQLAALVYPGSTMHEIQSFANTTASTQLATTEAYGDDGRVPVTSPASSQLQKAITSRQIATPISSKEGHWVAKEITTREHATPISSKEGRVAASASGGLNQTSSSQTSPSKYVYSGGSVVKSPGDVKATFKFSAAHFARQRQQ